MSKNSLFILFAQFFVFENFGFPELRAILLRQVYTPRVVSYMGTKFKKVYIRYFPSLSRGTIFIAMINLFYDPFSLTYISSKMISIEQIVKYRFLSTYQSKLES
jgi:hypothetical protein